MSNSNSYNNSKNNNDNVGVNDNDNDNEVMINDEEMQCGQITLSIPYRKISTIKFVNITIVQTTKSITNDEKTYRIVFDCKYEGLSKSQQPTVIERKFCEFQWLVMALKQHTLGRFVVLPILQKDPTGTGVWNYITNKITPQALKPSLTHQANDQQIKKINKSFSETMIQRYLNILSIITMKSLYPKPNDTENPVFIFIQEEDAFNFYLPLYEQQKKKTESSLKGYITGFWDYIPGFTKKKSIQAHGLELIHQQFTKLSNRTKQLQQKLTLNHTKLSALSQNFIQKQYRMRLKQKLTVIESLIQEMDYYLRYLNLVIEEINENMQAYSEEGGSRGYNNMGGGKKRSNENLETQKQIQEYIKFVSGEKCQIERNVTEIGRKFIEGVVESKARVKIQLRETYDDYRIVS